jgi:hypothetical protein
MALGPSHEAQNVYATMKLGRALSKQSANGSSGKFSMTAAAGSRTQEG